MPDAVQLVQSLVSGVGVGLIYGLVGIGFCVIYNASGIVNFAQGVFVMLGGMIAHVLLTSLGLPMLLAALIAIPLVALIGVVIELLWCARCGTAAPPCSPSSWRRSPRRS